jgi:hypothetical protein
MPIRFDYFRPSRQLPAHKCIFPLKPRTPRANWWWVSSNFHRAGGARMIWPSRKPSPLPLYGLKGGI